MIYSIYDELTSMAEDADGLAFRNKVINMGIAQIFDYAWNKHHPAGNFRAIVLFTVYTYSWESKMVRIGADWLKQKIRIAQKVELPEYLYDDVVHLKDRYLADSFQEFLHLYHDNMDYVHLTSLKELYQQVMSHSTRYVGDEKGNADLPEKFKNIRQAGELKEEIKALETDMLNKYRILNAAKSDFVYEPGEHGNPLQLENSQHIR